MGFMMICTAIVIMMVCTFVTIALGAIMGGEFEDAFIIACIISTFMLGIFVTEFLYNNGVIG